MTDLVTQLLKPFERMDCGALVLDVSGAVLASNASADRLLRSERTAPAAGDPDRAALKVLLGRAGNRFRIDQEAWITVPTESGAPLVLHAIPIASETLTGPHTLLVLVDLGRRPKPGASVLQRLFELTPAEARLAIELMNGKTLVEIAEQTGISEATARSQLTSIFTKTRTRRQPDLTALLTRVAILP